MRCRATCPLSSISRWVYVYSWGDEDHVKRYGMECSNMDQLQLTDRMFVTRGRVELAGSKDFFFLRGYSAQDTTRQRGIAY